MLADAGGIGYGEYLQVALKPKIMYNSKTDCSLLFPVGQDPRRPGAPESFA